MGRNKLAKFADMETYPNVYQYPYHTLMSGGCPLQGCWNEKAFSNSNPLVLELGCGRGEYAVALGKKNPGRNYIGIDIKGSRMWTGATLALEDRLDNVAFLRAEIENIGKLFAPDEVDELWLTFSDPQMKRASKRMTSTFFLERYRRFLKDGGIINVKTDSNFLFTYTTYMTERNAFPVLFSTTDLYHAEGLDADTMRILSIQTYYESQWIERGLNIKYMKFRLPATGDMTEPDVEIPVDDYRSYKRTRRSGVDMRK